MFAPYSPGSSDVPDRVVAATAVPVISRDGRIWGVSDHDHRRPDQGQPRQVFYAGVAKPKELAHDTRLHEAYLKASERLAARGASACGA